MGKITGFLELQRIAEAAQPTGERVRHYREFILALKDDEAASQGARCMDCGIPFCQTGCPIHNVIPDWNDLVYRHQWQRALEVLHTTNNFPEFTGRVCPAPCEASCVLNINNDPVGIKSIEHFIIDKGWEEGWVRPLPPEAKSGRRVAVVGSGPAGMACAQQLARAGHDVVLFEKADRIGGLLRYGIPDFKMEKQLIDRRMAQMSLEGVEFRPNAHIGRDIPAQRLLDEFDAIVLTGGAEAPRDLACRAVTSRASISRWSSCRSRTRSWRATSCRTRSWRPASMSCHRRRRHGIGLRGHVQSPWRGVDHPVRIAAAAAGVGEQAARMAELADQAAHVVVARGRLRSRLVGHHETLRGPRRQGREIDRGARRVAARRQRAAEDGGNSGSEFELNADLVLFAMGFVGPVQAGLLDQLGVERDARSNVKADTDSYQTSVPKVFAAGDVRRGQSLVVWAIREGRQAARAVDEFLMGSSKLPR
jgi:glutamate synthase (NADPH/NADH) small chain